jgi:hypothetical protein
LISQSFTTGSVSVSESIACIAVSRVSSAHPRSRLPGIRPKTVQPGDKLTHYRRVTRHPQARWWLPQTQAPQASAPICRSFSGTTGEVKSPT